MGDVLVTGAPHLPVVRILGEGVGTGDLGNLRFREVLEERQAQIIDGGGYGDFGGSRLCTKLVLKVAAAPVVWPCRVGSPAEGSSLRLRGVAVP